MTFADTQHDTHIIGPFSIWPQPKRSDKRRIALMASAATGIGVFLHCIAPMMIGA